MKSFVQVLQLGWIAVPLLLFSCHPSVREGVDEKQFAGYWYQGKAEINVFDLQQSRYGEERSGQAVMIFVTEDFSKRRQVKVDQPQKAGKDAKKVLKLNMTREFVTGVYPYHTMLSVFTPVTESVNSLKITSSVTEWCGQAFTQLNWKNNAYHGQLFSYFESEGDQQVKIDGKAEDELFNLIRLNPDLLPTGDVRLIPSLTFQRLSHIPLKAERAMVSVKELGSSKSEVEVAYKEIGRTLIIRYEKFFPYEILFWQEVYSRENGKVEITTATRSSMQMMDYWNKNGKEFEPLRKELGL